MRIFFLCLFGFTSLQLCAQRECATREYIEQQKLVPSSLAAMAEVENFIQRQPLSTASSVFGKTSSGLILRVPVVVHVLYNTGALNISDAQIKSGIDALNRDFRKLNSDTVNTPQRFRQLAADVEIEFVLASADPQGRATNGITRKQTDVAQWKMDDKIKYTAHGGRDAWDSKSYLNIWLGNLRGLLGYASAPGGPLDKDGLVIHSSVFGTENVRAPYHLGRTAVHEVGHWLGLKHIWGDTYCGDDLVGDTPNQGNFTAGCPGSFRSSCSNGTTGDMYMNYMDFTDDACMNLFTEGQKQRMRALFNDGGPRASLPLSKGLYEPWMHEQPPVVIAPQPVTLSGHKLYPNPATANTILDLSYDPTWVGKEVRVTSATGIVVKKITITAKAQTISLQALTPGLYFIQADNGEQKIRQRLIRL